MRKNVPSRMAKAKTTNKDLPARAPTLNPSAAINASAARCAFAAPDPYEFAAKHDAEFNTESAQGP